MDNIFNYTDCITPVSNIQSIKIFGCDKLSSNIPFFTIVIPTYKRVSTLSDAIESALYQENFDDYNVIVVDNNPERYDETEKFMQRYSNHPKVTYYKNSENLGMAGNWNKCATLSSSDKFILLHDDDIIAPTALYSFSKILRNINGPWSLIKPSIQKFSSISDLNFVIPSTCHIQKHCIIDYFGADCTGAPTIALFNRDYYRKIGGANQAFYPSFDYVMSFSLNRFAPTYSLDIVLGGYRVGVNESLSKNTMDMYFEMKFYINEQIFKKYYIPSWLGKSILTQMSYQDYSWAISYYDMKDYKYDFSSRNLNRRDGSWQKIFFKIYYKVLKRIINKINSFEIKLS